MNTENNTNATETNTNTEVKTPKATLASVIRQVIKGLRRDRTITVSKVVEQATALAAEQGVEATVNYRAVFRALSTHAEAAGKGLFKRKAAADEKPAEKAKAEKKPRAKKEKKAEAEDNTAGDNTEAPEMAAEVPNEAEMAIA